jgi:hypothetical protein
LVSILLKLVMSGLLFHLSTGGRPGTGRLQQPVGREWF